MSVESVIDRSLRLLEGGEKQPSVEDLKATLDVLRQISPELDAKLYERLSRLVDSKALAEDTRTSVDALRGAVEKLGVEVAALKTRYEAAENRNGELLRRVGLDLEANRVLREKQRNVLELMEQYLRRH